MVHNVSFVDKSGHSARVVSGHNSDFGSSPEWGENLPHTLVLVRNRDTSEESGFVIVSSRQADPDAGFISEESPIGGVLKGARTGQSVTIATPDGILRLQVLSSTNHEGR